MVRRVMSAVSGSIWAVILIVILAGALALRYVVTAPPHQIRIAAGGPGGYFDKTAQAYRAQLDAQGVELVVVHTGGASANLDLLREGKVDLALIHGGLADAATSRGLVSLGSVDYEPVWVFCRAGLRQPDSLSALRGKRIGTAQRGNGAHVLAQKLLAVSGVTAENSVLIDMPIPEARRRLRTGELDAAFFMAPPESPIIREMFNDPQLRLLDMRDAEGLRRNLPFLHALELPRGTVDPATQQPAADMRILATTATLAAREDLHPAIQYLLMTVIDVVHEPPGLLHSENEFPSDKDVDLPLSPQAELYYSKGKPFLQRYLPFGLASIVERLLKVALPLFLLALPFIRLIPAVFNWRVKRKLFKCYRMLIDVEKRLYDPAGSRKVGDYEAQLDAIEARLNSENIPLGYTNEVYVLREHIELARRHIARTLRAGPDPDQAASAG